MRSQIVTFVAKRNKQLEYVIKRNRENTKDGWRTITREYEVFTTHYLEHVEMYLTLDELNTDDLATYNHLLLKLIDLKSIQDIDTWQ